MMTSSSPEQTQSHDANEQQASTAYQQPQQRQPHRRPSTSAGRSIAPIFPNDPDSIELKQYTRNLPQIHDDDDHDEHDDHDDHLQEGQATPDSCSHDDGNTNTGVTTPDLKGFPEQSRRTSFSAPSATSSTTTGHVHSRLSIFWANNISIVVPSKDARDHLGRQLYSLFIFVSIFAHSFLWIIASLDPGSFFSHFPLCVAFCLSSPDILSSSTVPLIRWFPSWDSLLEVNYSRLRRLWIGIQLRLSFILPFLSSYFPQLNVTEPRTVSRRRFILASIY